MSSSQLRMGFQIVGSSDVHNAVNNPSSVYIKISELVSVWTLNRVVVKFDIYYPIGNGYFRVTLTLFNSTLSSLPEELKQYNTLGSALAFFFGLVGKEPQVSLDNVIKVKYLDLTLFPSWVGDFYNQLILGRSTYECKISQFERGMKSGKYKDIVQTK